MISVARWEKRVLSDITKGVKNELFQGKNVKN